VKERNEDGKVAILRRSSSTEEQDTLRGTCWEREKPVKKRKRDKTEGGSVYIREGRSG